MSNTRKWDKRKMESQLPQEKWIYLNLLFPILVEALVEVLVEAFISHYTFVCKKGMETKS